MNVEREWTVNRPEGLACARPSPIPCDVLRPIRMNGCYIVSDGRLQQRWMIMCVISTYWDLSINIETCISTKKAIQLDYG